MMIVLLAFGAVAVIAAWAVAEGLTPRDPFLGDRTAGAVRSGKRAAVVVALALPVLSAWLATVGGDSWRAGALAGAVVAGGAWYVARWLSQRGWIL